MIASNLKIAECLVGNAFRDDELFRDLSSATTQFLTAIRSRQRFENNAEIFVCDKLPHWVYVLIEGEAVLTDRTGTPLRSISAHEIVGMTEAITNEPYAMRLHTVTPCLFDRIRRDDFILFLKSEPDVSFRLLKLLGLNLQKVLRILATI